MANVTAKEMRHILDQIDRSIINENAEQPTIISENVNVFERSELNRIANGIKNIIDKYKYKQVDDDSYSLGGSISVGRSGKIEPFTNRLLRNFNGLPLNRMGIIGVNIGSGIDSQTKDLIADDLEKILNHKYENGAYFSTHGTNYSTYGIQSEYQLTDEASSLYFNKMI